MDYGGADSIYFQAKPGASRQKHVKFILGHSSVENQDSTDTLSSSTSESSSTDDFFQVNPQILPKFTAQNKPPLSKGGTKPFFKNEEIDVSSEALYRLEESLNGSPGSTSQFSDITHESLIPQFSPTQSPPIQIMEKNGGFDPNRIPISVFSKSSTPTEWSVASNDSLFSIRIGESSFSRDHVLKIDLDLPKSRELLKSGELSKSPKRSGELIRFGPTSPNFKGIEPYFDIEKTISEDVTPEGIQIVNEKISDGSEDLMNNHVIHVDAVMRTSRDSYVAKCHSDKSEIRVQPFAKPIYFFPLSRKKKSSTCPLCQCCNCCQAFCDCKWLTCSCKWLRWPSCSFKCCINCFKWPSCHCKCPNLSSCSCKCPNLSNCCCRGSNWSSCCCKSPNCPNLCCKCPNWSSLCCKCSSWSCCKCSSWSCCKCSSWSCFKCSSWSCFRCRCLNCTLACCYCWNREQKRSSYDSSVILTDGDITNSKSSTTKAASSQRNCVCFSCSCCSCWSCSCCC